MQSQLKNIDQSFLYASHLQNLLINLFMPNFIQTLETKLLEKMLNLQDKCCIFQQNVSKKQQNAKNQVLLHRLPLNKDIIISFNKSLFGFCNTGQFYNNLIKINGRPISQHNLKQTRQLAVQIFLLYSNKIQPQFQVDSSMCQNDNRFYCSMCKKSLNRNINRLKNNLRKAMEENRINSKTYMEILVHNFESLPRIVEEIYLKCKDNIINCQI